MRKGADEENIQMEVGLYFCSCGENYVSDTPFHNTCCLKCGSDLKIELDPTMKQLSLLEDRQLEHLWNLFSKITFDERSEGINERFLIWLPTTNRFFIWLWFADHYSDTFANLPGKISWLEQGRSRELVCECGVNIAKGSPCFFNFKHGKVLCDVCGDRIMMDFRLFEGYRNSWIRRADDPPFTRDSFRAVKTMTELIEIFRQGNCSLGQALIYKNLTFINQQDGGDEWLTIKDWCPFDSISFKAILKHGDNYTRQFIKELLRYQVHYRKSPDYSIIESFI